MSREQIENNLSYHPVTDETKPEFERNRRLIKDVALDWDGRLPAGRHASLAQTALQEALMWANAAIACDTGAPVEEPPNFPPAAMRITPPPAMHVTPFVRPGMAVRDYGFGWALEALQAGRKVAREGWNGKGQFLELQAPDEHSKMTLPYIFIVTVTGHRVPWLASQTDMLATDWWMVA